ncbi:MAG: tetratricopeptide repeat protein [Prevotella sp.]|jgi:tetratricopeptide (TPR) repeat protein|nr:tetratricopeptide repeat protein [Prevotella sp.]
MTAEEWYNKGNEHRRHGDWQHALNCYMEAIDIDPQSPAVEAREMLISILDFYNKDAYNP